MEFLVFTLVGLAAALVHILVHGAHRLVVSAFAVGVLGAWMGALTAGTAVQGGWANFGALQFVGSVVGAVGSIEVLELVADVYARHHPDEFA